MTASIPKGATLAIERGDDRVLDAFRKSYRQAFSMLESYATTRVPIDGRQEDRVTGNLVGYAVEHAETRPVEDESLPADHPWRIMPLPDRHVHLVLMNVTWDEVEGRWKAVKFRPIMDLRQYFDRCFDSLFAAELTDLGYEIETKFKEDNKGNSRYYSWDIKGMPAEVIARLSKRSEEIDRLEQEIVAGRKKEDKYAPDHLSAAEKDKLGATSRRVKRDDLTLEECREYWETLYAQSTDAIDEVIRRAKLGLNPRPQPMSAQAVDFSLRAPFREGVGAAGRGAGHHRPRARHGRRPAQEVGRELTRQGVILRQERRQDAGDDRGVAGGGVAAGRLRPRRARRGRPDRRRRRADPHADERRDALRRPVGRGRWDCSAVPTGSSSSPGRRGPGNRNCSRNSTKGRRWPVSRSPIWARPRLRSRCSIRTGSRTPRPWRPSCSARRPSRPPGAAASSSMKRPSSATPTRCGCSRSAQKNDLKLIFAGDEMQHGSIGRGNFMRLMTEHGRIKPFRLSEILRQKDPAYRAAAQLLSEGKTLDGFEALDGLGWVKEMANGEDRYRHMAADYVQALSNGVAWNDVLVVAPTHREAGFITGEIRRQLRDAGRLGTEEREFTRLAAAEASEAERGLASTYRDRRRAPVPPERQGRVRQGRAARGHSGHAGQSRALPLSEASRFTLHRREKIALAAGDVIRFTGTVQTLGSDHALKNGTAHAIAGFTDAGNIRLDNGWVIGGKEEVHIRSGFVETSIGSQGRTVKQVILGMSAAMGKAVNMQQLYVSSSRARDRMRVYLDEKDSVRDAIQRDSRKLLALDLKPEPEAAGREKGEKQRLDDVQERRRRAAYDRFMAEWNGPQPGPDFTPPMPPGAYRDFEQSRQQERGYGHGR